MKGNCKIFFILITSPPTSLRKRGLMRVFKTAPVSVFCLLFFSFSFSQDVKVHGHFASDSVKLGNPISFYLTARYPQSSNIVFPDSTFSFAPFEFQKKKFVPTLTKDSISYDSVIYTLNTFEIDSIQSLKLPVFIIQEKDCTVVYSETDAVFFNRAVKNLPDSVQLQKLPLKTNTNYFDVSWLFNYPLASIISGVLIALLMVCWIIFGKMIIRYFKIKRLNKKHVLFIQQFDAEVEKSKATFSRNSTELALVIWKKYLENLIDIPFTKYTTKEISQKESDAQLLQSLAAIDRMIYANQPGEQEHFSNLRNYSEDQFAKKIQKLRNG